MSARWIRNAPDRGENLGAGIVAAALAVGVGLAAFYVVRLLVAREPLDDGTLPDRRDGPDEAEVEQA